MTQAFLFDGVTADRHIVGVSVDGGDLLVEMREHPLDPPVRIKGDEINIISDDAKRLTLGWTAHEGWRLTLPKPEPAEVTALIGSGTNYGRWIDRLGLGKAAVALGAVAAVVLAVGYSAPVWLAPLVPESWEQNLGTALVGDFGEYACHSTAADSALKKMAQRIEPTTGTFHAIPMTVLDVGMFNAAAIPGNQIVIFKGALDDTDNPDAMAGILAHEMGHVRKRHVTQALIRELGIGALIRVFAGDIGANAQQLVSLSYTRANEEEADREAIQALDKANIDPRPTATLFRKLEEMSGGMDSVKWLNSHPQSAERAKWFDASWKKGRVYQPALDAADYDALKKACAGKPKSDNLLF